MTTAIIAAGGSGQRFGAMIPKQFNLINQLPIICYSIKTFESVREIDSIIIVVNSEWLDFTRKLITKYSFRKVAGYIFGGEERQDSISNCLKAEEIKKSDIVIIHDAARPFVTEGLTKRIIQATKQYGAAIPVLRPSDTIKRISHDGYVVQTLDRTTLGFVQTPQGFSGEIFRKMYKGVHLNKYKATDDAMLAEWAGIPVRIIEGDEQNFKITTPYDIKYAEFLVSSKKPI